MHTAALEKLGLGGEWRYEAIDVQPRELEKLVARMPNGDFVGANVTVPLKVVALKLAGEASPAAREIGAANTLVFDGSSVSAENTDAPGLLAALPSPPAGKRVLVLGAGGAAWAAVWALAREGAAVDIWNRTADNADRLVDDLFPALMKNPNAGIIRSVDRAAPEEADLIINCTSLGMAREDIFRQVRGFDPDAIGPRQTVVEMVYASGETELATVAKRAGASVVDGYEVLVRQGAESLRIWLERAYGAGAYEPPLEVMRAAARSG
jgi:shikimate dehydrogenase